MDNFFSDDDHLEFQELSGEVLPDEGKTKNAQRAAGVLKVVGLSSLPNKTNVDVGVNFRGSPVYSNTQLANSKDLDLGNKLANTSGMALGAMGAFEDTKEASKFVSIGQEAKDINYHRTLDTLKNKKDPKGFLQEIGGDKNLNGFTGYKLYENWNNLSPAQKALGIAGAKIQGFTFNDGKTFETKRLTPEIPGVPSLNAAEGLKLAGQGINVSPAAKKWNQYSAIQETFYSPKSGLDIVNTGNSLGILGFGMDGRSVPIDDKQMASAGMKPEPHFGIGAATIPAGQGVPSGYVQIKNLAGRTLIAPKANRGSIFVNAPDVASEAAGKIYSLWDKQKDTKQNKGVIGGSALAGGLDDMTQNNPYSLGAVITVSTLYNTPPAKEDYGDLQHVSYLNGINLQRLSKGKISKETDQKGSEHISPGEFTEDSYKSKMKEMRGKYAEQGISSKEIGYQLANQGYAEGRFNESETVSIHRSLDMVFDTDSFSLAQKLTTGKNKGLEILGRRNG